MIRMATRGVVLLAAIALVLDTAAGKQGGNPDKIYVRDKTGAVKSYEGSLKFSPAGYQIVNPETNKAQTVVSPADIVKVVPGELAGVDRNSILLQVAQEEKKTRKDYEAVRLVYGEMLQKAASAPPKTREYLSFKKALMGTRILDEADDDDFSKQIDPLTKEWNLFLSEYKTGWEIWPAARINARLLTELGKFKEVDALWRQMGAKDVELPADLKQEAILQMIDAQIRSGGTGYASAKQAADAELKAVKDLSNSTREKLAIYSRTGQVEASAGADELAAAVKEIEERVAASKEPSVRGVGYGMIGELYLAANKPRDAMWAFLWVETVYNQDKDEVLKAMVRLEQIFKAQMDDDREKSYKEKIRRFRSQT